MSEFDKKFWAVYHKAWSDQVGARDYDKAAWGHVQLRIERILARRGEQVSWLKGLQANCPREEDAEMVASIIKVLES